MACASTRAEYGPCSRPLAPCPVATQALPQPGSPAHDGAIVGRGGPQPHPRLEVGGAVQSRRDGQALAQQLVRPAAVTLTENPAPASNVPPQATRPPGQGTR